MDVTPATGSPASRSDWDVASESLRKSPTRWGSLTWVSARPLIASLNHALALGSRGLVTGLRRHWSAQDPVTIEVPGEPGGPGSAGTTFFLIGDTGEQDASQYVVAPALSAAATEHQPAFVLIMSDVIYPSGDVNDYPDGVYRPYRSADESFSVKAPLLALPGNHDWYDGLAGFMYHFVDGSRMPSDKDYAHAEGQGTPLSRLCRILWRRPSAPDARTKALREGGRLTGPLTQPGPYYAIDTPDLRVVCIDTGIDGTIDEQQGAWLRRVSAGEKSKILVTGKPLVVDEEIRRCRILADDPAAGAADLGTVWDVVQERSHHYVATVGGDVHNFQRYDRPAGETGPQVHLVAGGGGAFLHATHTVSVGANDSRMRARPGREYYGSPTQMFPTRNESLGLFAGLLVPTLRRIMIYLSLLLIGATATFVVMLNSATALSWLDAWTAALAAGCLLAVLAVSAAPQLRALPRSSRWSRLRASLIMVTIGVLSGAVAQLLGSDHLSMYVGFVAVVLVLHAVADSLIRESGWWRPADEFARNPRIPVFLAGLAVLALVVGLAQLGLGWSSAPRTAMACAVASALLLLVVGLVGLWCRRRRLTTVTDRSARDRRPELRGPVGAGRPDPVELGQQNRRWHRSGLATGQAAQAVCVLLGVAQLLILNGTAAGLLAALGTILATLAAAAVFAAALLLGWAAALLGLTELTARVGRRRGGDHAVAWGAAARQLGRCAVPLLLIVLVLLLAAVTAVSTLIPALRSIVLHAAAAPLTVVVVLVVVLLVVDALRRAAPRRYLWYTLLVLGGLAAVGWLLFLGSATRWIVTYSSGAALVLLTVGVVAVIGHLSFLGAYWLILDRETRGVPTFTTEQLEEIFRVRQAYPPETPDPAIVPRHVLRWARITSPALGEPGGILQKEVSEIFSSDRPPFYKSFLRLTTSAADDRVTLSIFLHRVYGVRPSDDELVASLTLPPPADAAATPRPGVVVDS